MRWILTNNDQPMVLRPISQSISLVLVTPVLPVTGLPQMQHLRRAILWRQSDQGVTVLPRPRWRSGRLVGHDLFVSFHAGTIVFRLRKLHFGDEPVAHLAPFGVVSAWCIWICHRKRKLRELVALPRGRQCVDECDLWGVLCVGRVYGVANICGGVIPGEIDGKERLELVDDCWNDFGLLESASVVSK